MLNPPHIWQAAHTVPSMSSTPVAPATKPSLPTSTPTAVPLIEEHIQQDCSSSGTD